MRLRFFAALCVLAACTPATPPVAPSTPPPIPPRSERVTPRRMVFGSVREPGGSTPAAFALVSASVDGIVRGSRFADERGEFEIAVEGDEGPIRIEATHGGATGKAPVSGNRAEVTLDRLPPMTRAEAMALVDSFVKVLNGDSGDEVNLTTYVRGGPEAMRTALEDYRALLGENIVATPAGENNWLLHGSKGSELSVSAYQDNVRRLHSPLLYYSYGSRLFAASFSRLVASDDAERLARLLTADDLDYPVEAARKVIARYKPPFETRGGRYELIGVDETRNTLTYRITWMAAVGDGEKSAEITLRYGDGLLGLVE